jgi:hypothetical protein
VDVPAPPGARSFASRYGEAAFQWSRRSADAGAKLVIASDGQFRRGKAVALKESVDVAVEGHPAVEHPPGCWPPSGPPCPAPAGSGAGPFMRPT